VNELLNVLRLVPRPARWLTTFFLLAAMAFGIGRMLKLGNRSWILAAVVLACCCVYALVELIRGKQQKKKSREFEGSLGLHSRKSEVGKEEIREALAELSEKWQASVAQLRETGMSIYDLPWYLLIGEPQSGKSTTLKNSGLEFPVGADALSGAGGTRNCDWWFTDEAVILDTAGRFTFQEESAPDQQEWEMFLKLLRKHRRDAPINGAIVVIPATSLVEDTAEEQEKKAKNIRLKLLHLQKVLEIRFPIFILVTKADRVLGFTEFFSKLEPAEQRQLFGWSNPGPPDEGWNLESFGGVFDGMVERVHKQRMRFLKEEDNLPLVDKLFVFPEEMAAIREPLANYLHTVFKASRFEEPFLFRGFYLTSGVQQGRPIALACRDLLRVQYGDPQGVLEDLDQVFSKSRAFFIRDFYEKKLFPEKGLIARTRLAEKKGRRYRMVMYGLGGTLAALTLILLGFGWINLFRVVSPIKDDSDKAKVCLKRDATCEIPRAYELIQGFETHKRSVREAKWTMRTFLKSADRNEISGELIPAIQGELFERNVLAPLLVTFETRAGTLNWDAHAKDYDSFYGGLQNLLRFRRLSEATARDDVKALQADLRIKPFLDFARVTPGGDPQGKALDDWLKQGVSFDQADQIFQDAMGTSPDLTGLPVPEPAGSHNAFRNYWTVRNLARWDALTDEYLRNYKRLSEEMLGLAAPAPLVDANPYALTGSVTVPPSPVPPVAPPPVPVPGDPNAVAAPPPPGVVTAVLARFNALNQAFVKNYTDGEAHMKTSPQAANDRRPGAVGQWETNCRADYEALLAIAPALTRREDVAAHCRTIPGSYSMLLQGRQQYAYLYQLRAEANRQVMGWSPDAGRVREPLVSLGTVTVAQQIEADAAALGRQIDEQVGAQGRIDLMRRAYAEHTQRAFGPVNALAALAGPGFAPPPPVDSLAPAGTVPPPAAPLGLPVSTAFRVPEGTEHAREIAALALAQRILPPAARFFTSEKAFGCANCFNPKHADDHVPLANEFLRWAKENLRPAMGQPEVSSLIEQIGRAEFDYLDRYLAQQRWGSGGGGGGGGMGGQEFAVPQRAAQATSWRDYVRAVRAWEPVIERPGGGGGGGGMVAPVVSGGLTEQALESYVAGNDDLRPLLDRFREKGQAVANAAAARKPPKPPSEELVTAAQTFKRCIAGLEESPLAAWKQLAGAQDGASLADFHAFTGNRRLLGLQQTQRMIGVENKGAELLVREIRPQFTARLSGLWTIAGSCCNDRFPFISRARLQGQQESYLSGPSAGGPWAPVGRDTQARSVTNALQLDTVTFDALDRLFFAGGSLDSLFDEFVIAPIVEGREKAIDFVGGNKDRLHVLRQWQHFIYGDGRTSASQKIQVKLLSGTSTAPRIFLGERMGQVDLFGPNSVRPSTDAARVRILTMPLLMEDRAASIIGRNEDKSGGWSGILSLRGGPLKIPYFLTLASQGRPREGGKVWTVRIQLPDYTQAQQRLEGVFELTFERPLPEIVPGAALDAP
jgi:DNA polymerase III delta prime subunit